MQAVVIIMCQAKTVTRSDNVRSDNMRVVVQLHRPVPPKIHVTPETVLYISASLLSAAHHLVRSKLRSQEDAYPQLLMPTQKQLQLLHLGR